MSDFYQVGVIATFHRLDDRADGLEQVEAELQRFAIQRPMSLVLPSLASEFEGPALPRILEQLRTVRYLDRMVLSLDRASRHAFDFARRSLDRFESPTRVIWHDGPRLQEIYRDFQESGLVTADQGKGRSCWLSFGYVLAEGRSKVIAMHDADIVTYDRSMLARLCYPIANPSMGYEFCKGYYPRVSNRRMHGRVTRLLITPLLRSLTRIVGANPILAYLDSFRYALAGELSMDVDLARVNRIPADWGLEVGTLAEVFRNTSLRRVCQVGLAERYDHKHQELSPEDPSRGLLKMSVDISGSLFRTLASEGIALSHGLFRSLIVTYVRTAEDTIKRFRDDAAINGLEYDIHAEETAVATFARALNVAAERFVHDPLGAPLIPNWNRVTSALPNILERIQQAVDSDNA
jgi:glucosyl-3-phosphoglycerate synthase